VIEADLTLPGGRRLHTYDSGPDGARLTVFWHHGTPNTGAPPEPLFPRAAELGIRWVSYDRPGYGGSSPQPGRDIASAALDTRFVADALGIDRFTVLGHSGGGPHALACAALLPDRVLAAASIAGMAPFDATGFDWFAGMADAATLRAATRGRAALEHHVANADFDRDTFTPADHAALSGTWSWFGGIVNAALSTGPGGLIDDQLAYVAPWGFSLTGITAPVLLVHGTSDRMVPASHSEWLAEVCPTAELHRHPGEGHISVLNHATEALDWLAARTPGWRVGL
jgi:pimeloyl-ACP methyl ester carboxylesterase